MKRGLDQLTAWVTAVVLAGGVYGAVYAAARLVARHETSQAEEVAPGHEGGEQDEAGGHEGGEHDAPAAEEHDSGGHEETPAGAHAPAEHETKPEGHGKAKEGHDDAAAKPHGGQGPQWEYKGSAGPDHWGSLASEFKTCGTGSKQSPVDIDETVTNAKLLPVKFHYKSDDVVLKNDGHTIQGDFPTGNFIEVDGERFDLVQFHFHAPSEHKMAGIPYDLEMQLVHRNIDGQLVVVGVLFEEGAENKALKPIWDHMPHEVAQAPEPVEINPNTFLPERRQYFTYVGSLTSPPCTEGVKWLVLANPELVSSKQVDQFVAITAFNARPVQKLKGRIVAKSTR